MKITMVNPLTDPQWDEQIQSTAGHSFFHSSLWADVLSRSYRYKPVYFVLTDGGRLRGLLPLMEVRSLLTGCRGVSLAFTDFCEPLIDTQEIFTLLFDHIINYGRSAGWKYIELRGGEQFLSVVQESAVYVGHTLDTAKSEQELQAGLRDSTRRNIRKAENEGVETEICTSMAAVAEFYRLHCITRKRHGLPPQPFTFFRNIYECIIARNNGFVALTSLAGRTIAAAVYFHFGAKAIYKYGASDKSCQSARANNHLMWQAIKWCSANGVASLDFGRTACSNQGLCQFKDGWGTTKKPLRYYRFDIGTNRFDYARAESEVPLSWMFKCLPQPVLKAAGQLLYRHMG